MYDSQRGIHRAEGCVLGIVWVRGPCTAYVIRTVFLESLSPYWSGSAGAIYPLVARLEGRGLLAARIEPRGGRSRRELTITPEGVAALHTWIRPLPEWTGQVPVDPVRTRMYFLGGLAAKEQEAFLADAEAKAREVKPSPQVLRILRESDFRRRCRLSSEPNVQPFPALTLVDPPGPEQAAEPAEATSRWSLARRILFRFAFAYLVLYNLPFPLGNIPYVDALVFRPWAQLWSFIVPAVAEQAFGVEASIEPNGSGDTTWNYVQVFCFLILALAATAIWTFLDRRRANYARLHEWLRVYVRFSLALTLLLYGAIKVIPSQFPAPSLDRLLQPFGDASPMGILWTFMGASASYTIFSGVCEMLGGFLLVARRTTLLGALVGAGVLTNVVALNIFYDVPVKLFSAHLLLMAVFLILPDLRRLTHLLVLNRRAEPAEIRPLFRRKWLHWSALALRTVLIFGSAGLYLFQAYEGNKEFGRRAPKPPLYGIWTVEEFEMDGVVRPPLVTDETRWRRFIFGQPGTASIQLMSDTRQRYRIALQPEKKLLQMTKREDAQAKSSLSYTQPAPGQLTVRGTVDGHKIRARLRRVEDPDFPLLKRGFHWINEFPYNR